MQDLAKAEPLGLINVEAALHQVFHLLAHPLLAAPSQPGSNDLLVCLEGNVPTHHVVQEDAQGPHGEPLCSVHPVLHPLWGGVDSGALELLVNLALREHSGAKVDQLDLVGVQVDQDILVLDVPVHHTLLVTGHDGLQQLLEDISSERLLERP